MTIRKKKVLIVDDQESLLLIESRLAEFAGYEPITTDNGDEALESPGRSRSGSSCWIS